ncbi:MAG: ABC transporter ATP-binding protein [Acidobacteriota bacterium]
MTQIVHFEHVSKRYRLGLTRTSLPTLIGQWVRGRFKGRNEVLKALDDVSFYLRRGESLALVGPNGAGKTTILKLLARITRPSSGNIKVHGRLSALIELGAGFHPDLTGAENVYLNGAILGLTKAEISRRYDAIVEFSELERFMQTPLKRYSSGMVVRLGFAVASCVAPELLLVDEVLAVGDVSFRQKCLNRITQLLAEGTSIIFVSHNLWLVQAVCKSALYLEAGKVKMLGPTAEVVAAYEEDLHRKRALKLQTPRDSDTEQMEDWCEITSVEIVPAFPGAPELRPEEPAEVRVRYAAYQAEEVSAVIRIVRSDGVTCCMMRTRLDRVKILLERGEGVIRLRLNPLQLRGGVYFVQAILRDASDVSGIATRSSDFFTVTGSAHTFSEMNGVFEPNRDWDHQPGCKLHVAGMV